MTINEASPEVAQHPISVSALIEHYIQHELCAGDDEVAKCFATQQTNKDFLRLLHRTTFGFVQAPRSSKCGCREVAQEPGEE
jgi:hypothetical protein